MPKFLNRTLSIILIALLCIIAFNSYKKHFAKSETAEIAEEGFIYGLPIVMNYAVMYDFAIDHQSKQFKAPFNVIKNEHGVFTYKDTTVITPNSDTPYSILMLDLHAEPMILTVPQVEKTRYYSVMLCDSNTYNFGYIGTRSTGNNSGTYMVVGPNWNGVTPLGIKKVFRSSTQFAGAVYRTQLFDANDINNVIKVQNGYKAQPLSAYLKHKSPTEIKVHFPAINKKLIKENFFEYLDFALQFAPQTQDEKDIREKLARIGVGSQKFNFKALSLKQKTEMMLGMKKADAKIKNFVATAGKNINNWRVSGAGGDASYYNGNWLLRAAVAMAGIYANDAVEAMYPYTHSDINGKPLDGSKHNYTLTFKKDELPPVNAFWSVTMYDGNTQLLIKNPINRYLINSPMLPNMKKNADGSLTIYIQNKTPGKDKEANWLPAPNGKIYLVMRLYWPKESAPSILPPGEGTWNPPGVQVT